MSLNGNMEVGVSPQSTGGHERSQQDISDSVFEVPDVFGTRDSSDVDPGSSSKADGDAAPERKLTLFAVQLSVLQRLATWLGALEFIWATNVALGGYISMLYKIDFWFVTVILLIECVRLFSRSHELEWQHQSIFTISHIGIHGFHKLKSISRFIVRVIKGSKGPISESQREEPVKDKKNNEEKATINGSTSSSGLLHTYVGWLFQSRYMSQLFYWLQLLLALASLTLSAVRLIDFSRDSVQIDAINPNMRPCLSVFYGLALVEGYICLLEKLYWEGAMILYRLLEKVNKNFDLGSCGIDCYRQFFYDAYSECVNKSIFDALKMDLVSYASNLLVSDSTDEQLIGVQILHKFSTTPRFADETLQKIGTSMTVIENLVEILGRKNPKEAYMRQQVAEIVSMLAGKKHYSLQIVGIPGAMDSISSLLYTQRRSDSASDELDEKKIIGDKGNYEFALNKFGLTILHELATDHDNCGKISNTRGLLSKIIECTYIEERLLRDNYAGDDRILAVQQSLQVLKLLAGTSGTVGNNLRQEIVENVFTVSNIREILKFGENYPKLQLLAIEILTSLAFDVKAKEIIGHTGGIIKELFRIFFQEQNSKDQYHAKVAAGETIAMLALDSDENCSVILEEDDEVLTKLMWALEEPSLRINSARILRYLCKFAGEDWFGKLQGVSAAAPIVLKAMISEEGKLQEAMLGLATQIFKFMTFEEASTAFNQVGIDKAKLAMKLLQILKTYRCPSIKVPRMRRFVIELAILMIEKNKAMVQTFKAIGMVEEIRIMRQTTSEIESFNIFSGTAGLSRQGTEIHRLVRKALKLLADK